MRGRPARREPGAHRPDGRRAQDAHVQAAREDGLQGDRGRLPEREPDRLRLLPRAHRGRAHPRRRDDPGAHPVPRPPHRAHLRRDPRQQDGHRALLQLDVGAAAPRRVRDERGGHHRHRPPGRAAVPQARGDGARDRRLLRVLAGVLHRHRARVRGAHLQRGHRRHRPDARPQADHQPARHRRDGHARTSTPTPSSGWCATSTAASRSSSACTRTTTAARAWPRPSSATSPVPTASRAACSATGSAPATSAWSPWA